MKRLYAVKAGRKTGIFYTWEECEAQVSGYKGALFKGFNDYDALEKAERWLAKTKAPDVSKKPKKKIDFNEPFKWAKMKHGKTYKTTYAKDPNTEFYNGDLPPWN